MLPYYLIGSFEISMYSLFNSLALFAAIIFNLCLFRQKKDLLSAYTVIRLHQKPEANTAKYVFAEIIILSAVQFCAGAICNSAWAKLLAGAGANYFGLAYWSAPIFLLVCTLVRVNPLKQLDLFTPSYAIALIFFKIGCFLHGCCQGKPSSFGLYFVARERYEFPSQLLELAVAFCILIILTRMLRKPRTPGSLFPLYLILYSSTRFFTEFTREGEAILLGLQAYQIQCIAGVLLGVSELMLIKKFGQRWSDTFDQKQKEYIFAKATKDVICREQ